MTAYTHYSEFDLATGNVIRHGLCELQHVPPPGEGCAVALVASHPGHDRIVYDILDAAGRAINPKVSRRPESIPKLEALLPAERPARITQGELAALLARIENLEAQRAGGDP